MVCQKNGSMLSKPSSTSARTMAAGSGAPARTIVPIRTSFSSLIPLSSLDRHASARLGALDRAQNHGQTADIVLPRRFRLRARANRGHEVAEDAEMSADAIVLGEGRRLDRRDGSEEAIAF